MVEPAQSKIHSEMMLPKHFFISYLQMLFIKIHNFINSESKIDIKNK